MQGNIPVMQGPMCGRWGHLCNAERLFGFIGSGPPKGPAPFSINYTIWDQENIEQARADGIEPMNEEIASCDVGVLVKILLPCT